jgi:hypothetical protein
MSVPGPSTIIRKKKRRRRRRAPLFPFVLLALAIIGVLAGGMWLSKRRPLGVKAAALPEGYVADSAALKQEYGRYYGNEDDFGKASGPFRSAADVAAKRNLAAVTSVLENATRRVQLPVVYHDLGVAYSLLGDFTRATDNFREVLARDPEYQPTRKYLRDLKGIPAGAAEPLTREQEPNDDRLRANLIGLKTPVGGEIASASDNGDFFRFVAPQAPRDLVSIEVTNHSPSFHPRLHVYDDQFRILSWEEKVDKATGTVRVVGGPAPNSTIFVSILSDDGKPGLYLLTVTPLKAFDRYEPNDAIMKARRITIGEEVSANVMDPADSDFYAFTSPRKGNVTVEIRNRSNTLIPVLGVYNADRRNIALVQDVQQAGSNLRHTIEADKDQTYYLQVSAQGGSAGAYILRVD